MKITKLLLILLIAVFTLTAFKCGKNKPPANSTVFPPIPIATSELPAVMQDFRETKSGAKVMGGFVNIPDEYLETFDDACNARIDTIKVHHPAWRELSVAKCEVLLLRARGVLTTIPNYPRPYLITTNGIMTAGTVMFSQYRPILLLPDYSTIDWGNRHFQFHAAYNEWEHASGFLNQTYEPVNDWLNWIGAGDTHPQITPVWLPEYAKTFPSLTDINPFDGLAEVFVIEAEEKEFEKMKESIQSSALKSGKKVEIYRIDKKDAEKIFDYVDKLQKDFIEKQ